MGERYIRPSFVWTSNKFFKNVDVDWRQLKPKMHVPSQSDPAPDSQFFRDDVMCEHGGLALNISARTRISHKVCQRPFAPGGMTNDFQAFTLLKTLFPSWVTLSDAVGQCAVCDTLAETSREDMRELRKRTEEEKVSGQRLYSHQHHLQTSPAGETQTYARECIEWEHSTSRKRCLRSRPFKFCARMEALDPPTRPPYSSDSFG